MKKIQVVLAAEKEPDFFSRQIMHKDKANYSHALILLDEGKTIFHAVGEGVCTEPADKFFETHIAVHTFDVVLRSPYDYLAGFVRGSLGKEYSSAQIASIAVGSDEKVNGDEKMICSELVGVVLSEMCGYRIEGNQDTWRPIHIYNALMEGPI